MGTSKFHGTSDVHLDMWICHIERFIINFFSPYGTTRNSKFVYTKLFNLHIENSLRCYIEPSTSTSIENLSRVWTIFTYIL